MAGLPLREPVISVLPVRRESLHLRIVGAGYTLDGLVDALDLSPLRAAAAAAAPDALRERWAAVEAARRGAPDEPHHEQPSDDDGPLDGAASTL